MDVTADPLYALRAWLTLVEGPIAFVLVLGICRRTPLPERRAYIALWGWLAGVAVVGVFAIVQYFTRFHLHPYWVTDNPDLVRSHATLDDPNALGSYLVLGVGLAIGLALAPLTGSSARWRRWGAIAIGIVALAALVTPVSRAAWIGLALLATVAMWPWPLAAPAIFVDLRRYSRRALVTLALLVGVWCVLQCLPRSGTLTCRRVPSGRSSTLSIRACRSRRCSRAG